jgi:hypothetical protein
MIYGISNWEAFTTYLQNHEPIFLAAILFEMLKDSNVGDGTYRQRRER